MNVRCAILKNAIFLDENPMSFSRGGGTLCFSADAANSIKIIDSYLVKLIRCEWRKQPVVKFYLIQNVQCAMFNVQYCSVQWCRPTQMDAG